MGMGIWILEFCLFGSLEFRFDMIGNRMAALNSLCFGQFYKSLSCMAFDEFVDLFRIYDSSHHRTRNHCLRPCQRPKKALS